MAPVQTHSIKKTLYYSENPGIDEGGQVAVVTSAVDGAAFAAMGVRIQGSGANGSVYVGVSDVVGDSAELESRILVFSTTGSGGTGTSQTLGSENMLAGQEPKYNFPAKATGVYTLATLADVPTINDRFKGKFTSLTSLQTSIPAATPGDYAQVDLGGGHAVANYNWDSEDGWVISGGIVGPATTDDLVEGSFRLYYTNARALAAVAVAGIYQALLTATNLGSLFHSFVLKPTPVDADELVLVDSADSNKTKKMSFTNFKAFLGIGMMPKTYEIVGTFNSAPVATLQILCSLPPIAGNTIKDLSSIKLKYNAVKSGVAGAGTVGVYFSTSLSSFGATQISTQTFSAASQWISRDSHASIDGSNIKGFPLLNASSDSGINNTTALVSAMDRTQPIYFFLAATVNSTGDTLSVNLFNVQLSK